MAPLPATPPADAATAVAAGLQPGPAFTSLPVSEEDAARALTAFRASCPSVMRRADISGLTRGADWRVVCDAAASARAARTFFAEQFELVQVGDGKAFATAYYEPEILASRQRAPGYEAAIYARPKDLVEIDLGAFSDDYKGRKLWGRFDERQKLEPYWDRADIVDRNILAGRGLEIAYAADPVEFFWLQIQGSGRLRFPDGSVTRIGYAGQNGRPYVGVGGLLRQRNILPPGGASMQGIIGWIKANPEAGHALMNENRSFIFFVEQTGPGPLGSLNIPVVARASVAADPRFVPLGAPVFLSMDRAQPSGLWVAQDTGGAIRGSNRFDTFWGAGPEARAIAGGLTARGAAFVLLPRGTLARLGAGGAGAKPTP
jgi:membrane-bound lytic murein transglycosylase A